MSQVNSTDLVVLSELLETIAKLVEATAKDPADAARIIREAKPKAQ